MYVRHKINQFRGLANGPRCFRHSLPICLVYVCLALSSTPAYAQSASFRSVDSNSDGALSYDELVAAFGTGGANRLLQTTDHNGDGYITVFELRRDSEDDRDSQSRSSSSDDDDDGRDERDDEDDDDEEDD